jgi:predicted N-acetyltransferase YhbS
MKTLEIAEVSPQDLPAVAELCGRAFVQPPTEYFLRTMGHDPQADQSLTLAGFVNETMVATLRVFARDIRWHGGSLRLAGIGNVATDPAHRGRGHALALMREAIALMAEWGFQISLLFTDIPPLYEKAGYALFTQPWWRVDPARLTPIDPRGVTVRPTDFERDLPSLLALQSSFNEGHDGTVIRSLRHWASMVEMYPTDDMISLVAERSGQLVGHARVMRGKAGAHHRLHELSIADPDAAVVIMAEAARHCAEAAAGPLLLTLPDWPIIRETIQRVFCDWAMTLESAGMWRDLPGGPSREEIMRRADAGDLYVWAGDRF